MIIKKGQHIRFIQSVNSWVPQHYIMAEALCDFDIIAEGKKVISSHPFPFGIPPYVFKEHLENNKLVMFYEPDVTFNLGGTLFDYLSDFGDLVGEYLPEFNRKRNEDIKNMSLVDIPEWFTGLDNLGDLSELKKESGENG